MRKRKFKNPVVGDRFGSWVVVGECFSSPHREPFVPVRCECGNQRDASVWHLNMGKTSKCKRCSIKIRAAALTTHGETGRDKIYGVWTGMKQRCLYHKHIGYKTYGGVGITVCKEWIDSFEVFRDWAFANGYEQGLEIDRIENNGNYEPSNCRWVTRKVNARNKSTNRSVTAWGETKTTADWADDPRCLVKYDAFMRRLYRGITGEQAMTLPLNYHLSGEGN
jgi:hypothetical protein